MDIENKILAGFLAAAVLFYGAAIHMDMREAERKIEQDFGIKAELNFEKDADKPNIYEQIEQKREELFNVTYNFVE